jgi:hypothetical protein
MTIVHRLVGYDRGTERVAFEQDIPPELFDTAKKIAGVPASDPNAAYGYELTAMQARDLAGTLGAAISPNEMDFFLESFDLGWRQRA